MTAEADARVSTALVILQRSRRRIQSSWRTLLGQRAVISGGSDADTLLSVLRRLAAGSLPLVDGKVWGQNGSGRRCVVCEARIQADQVEYESQADAGLSAHVGCFRLSLEESRIVERSELEETDGDPEIETMPDAPADPVTAPSAAEASVFRPAAVRRVGGRV
jgi:hypothetical protein